MYFTWMAILLALANEPAAATQAPTGEDKAPVLAPAPAPAGLAVAETNHDVAYRIGKDIRCPVCQGMSIAESPSPMAQDMMGRVRAMLKEGKTGEDIRAYFVQRYGVWVLLDPPKQGFILFVWLVPPVVLVGSVALAVRHMRRLRKNRLALVVPRAASDGPAVVTMAASETPASPATSAAVDGYLKAIRDEVRR